MKIGGKVLLQEIVTLFNLYLENNIIPIECNNAIQFLIHKKRDISNL